MNTARHTSSVTGRDAEARATSAHPTTNHPFQSPPAGSTVDLDRCTACGCTAGDSHHATSARVPEARAMLMEARRAATAAMGARRGSGLDDSVIADLDGRIARALDLLDGLNPRPYFIIGVLPETAQERQTTLPGVA